MMSSTESRSPPTPTCSTICSSRPSLLNNALHLNNQASLQIAKGKYDDAILTMSAALVQLKQSIRCLSSTDDTAEKASSSPPSHGQGLLLHFLMDDCASDDIQNLGASLLEDRVEDGDDWYLSRHPVQIGDISQLDSTEITELVSFAAIFNLGLCYHLQAISLEASTKESQKSRFQRAAAFYEHAQKQLSTQQATIDPHMIHSLVIANNLGHAYYFLGNEYTGKLCFQRLLNVIIYISDHRSGSEHLIVWSDQRRWDGFMGNIMRQHLISNSPHASAA
jgi:tetratricopeptide (TPR) repeat protein